ncbi:MAG: DUF736 domain-containing protein [Candidatus Micrarchaeota archaeon]|nr:DUF736 domain-containing protein [Candidatus Micrarchaeota archaeon]
MKEEEEKIEIQEGLEETSEGLISEAAEAETGASKQPEFRILQQEYNQREGRTTLKEVGVAWKNISQNGKEFYTIKIGNLRLLMFKNERR